MTRQFPSPLKEASLVSTLLIEAARCWREARDKRQPVQPRLFSLLSHYGHDMLAPVFDSLMTLSESVSGRRIATGVGPVLSEDELHLLDLVEQGADKPATEGLAASLNCAAASLRLLLRRSRLPAMPALA